MSFSAYIIRYKCHRRIDFLQSSPATALSHTSVWCRFRWSSGDIEMVFDEMHSVLEALAIVFAIPQAQISIVEPISNMTKQWECRGRQASEKCECIEWIRLELKGILGVEDIHSVFVHLLTEMKQESWELLNMPHDIWHNSNQPKYLYTSSSTPRGLHIHAVQQSCRYECEGCSCRW